MALMTGCWLRQPERHRPGSGAALRAVHAGGYLLAPNKGQGVRHAADRGCRGCAQQAVPPCAQHYFGVKDPLTLKICYLQARSHSTSWRSQRDPGKWQAPRCSLPLLHSCVSTLHAPTNACCHLTLLRLSQGWRFVFYVMAVVAGTVTLLVLAFGFEPRSVLHAAKHGAQGLLRTVLKGTQSMFVDSYRVFRVPTFVLLLLGEIVMVVGGSGAGFQVVYFQVLPLSAGHPSVTSDWPSITSDWSDTGHAETVPHAALPSMHAGSKLRSTSASASRRTRPSMHVHQESHRESA